LILQHFDEDMRSECSGCDICDRPEISLRDCTAEVKILANALKECVGYGLSRVIKIVCGSGDVKDKKDQALNSWRSGSEIHPRGWRLLGDMMVLHGLAERNIKTIKEQTAYVVLTILKKGLALITDGSSSSGPLRMRIPPEALSAGKQSGRFELCSEPVAKKARISSSSALAAPRGDTFQRLKEIRKKCADENGCTAFRIASDATLDTIVTASPKSKEDLLAIKGVGPKFMEDYADRFLEALQSLEARQEQISTE
jgi:ATP-dependent DNA helicase RecQ